MTLIWTRVDQKLIHGQVSLGWVPHLRINALVVADADTAADDWAKTIMRAAAPPEIEAIAFTAPVQLVELLDEERFHSRRVMAIFKDLNGAVEAIKAGLSLTRLNLGNQVCQRPGQDVLLGETFFACPHILEDLAEFQRDGLEVLIQTLPNGRAVSWKAEPPVPEDASAP